MFTSDKVIKSSNISNLVAFEPSKQPGTSTLKVLNFVATKMIDNFEIFFIVPDTVYINAHRMKDFFSRISVDDDLYVGRPAADGNDVQRDFCDVDAGIVVSQSVLKSFKANLVRLLHF